MRIIDLATPQDMRIHGDRARSPLNQLRAKIGPHTITHSDITPDGPQGTARDQKGKDWDWWLNEWGDIVVAAST